MRAAPRWGHCWSMRLSQSSSTSSSRASSAQTQEDIEFRIPTTAFGPGESAFIQCPAFTPNHRQHENSAEFLVPGVQGDCLPGLSDDEQALSKALSKALIPKVQAPIEGPVGSCRTASLVGLPLGRRLSPVGTESSGQNCNDAASPQGCLQDG